MCGRGGVARGRAGVGRKVAEVGAVLEHARGRELGREQAAVGAATLITDAGEHDGNTGVPCRRDQSRGSGDSITRDAESGRLLTAAAATGPGRKIKVLLARGELAAPVDATREKTS